MLFGHNSNVDVGSAVVHVQTEDRGGNHAFIDSTVHWKGRVLYRRTNNYLDLLPLDRERETLLKARLDDQHRTVVEELRSGVLKLTFPAPPPAVTTTPPALKVELTNIRTWLAGKQATLHLAVRDGAGNALENAETKARVEGAESPAEFSARTGSDGAATLEFAVPKLSGAEAALVIEAAHNGAKGHLRFQLRAKTKGRAEEQ